MDNYLIKATKKYSKAKFKSFTNLGAFVKVSSKLINSTPVDQGLLDLKLKWKIWLRRDKRVTTHLLYQNRINSTNITEIRGLSVPYYMNQIPVRVLYGESH